MLAEAATALADAYQALETLEVYGAWRVSRLDGSPRRAPGELPWDPPTPTAWATTLAFAREAQPRFAGFFQRAALSTPDAGVWRERRALAATGKALAEMGETLQVLSDLLPRLESQDDGDRVQRLLGQAWNRWEAAALVWDQERAESLACP